MRISLLDGFRGVFLISMAMAHVAPYAGSRIGWMIHHTNGWPDVAVGFVLLSGLIIGLVYGRRMLTYSPASVGRALRRRMTELYMWHLILVAVIFVGILSFAQVPEIIRAPWGDAPGLMAILAASLLSGPHLVDILPMYLVFMALTPLALRQLASGHEMRVIGLSVGAWAFAQLGLLDLWAKDLSALLGLNDRSVSLGLYFNRFGWQVLYFGGLVAGMRMAQDRLDLNPLKGSRARAVFVLALATTAAIGTISVLCNYRLISNENIALVQILFDRKSLSPLALIEFFSVGYIFLWLFVAGPNAHWTLARTSEALRRLFTWRPLVFLGQHSLYVYAWHVAMIYSVIFFLPITAPNLPQWAEEGLMVLVIASMFIPAWAHAAHQDRKRTLRSALAAQ